MADLLSWFTDIASSFRRPCQGVRLMLAGEIGQVRDMVAAVSEHGQAPDY
jgi:hypothetical protein